MSKRAICHRTEVRYSVEHVIPEALGGCYRRKEMVCVDCNSELGRRVDDALVNHGLSKMFRFVHGLRGKAKKAPNPFAGEYRLIRTSCCGRILTDCSIGIFVQTRWFDSDYTASLIFSNSKAVR